MDKIKSQAFQKENLIVLIILILVFSLTLLFYFLFKIHKGDINYYNINLKYLVTQVIDGNTFRISSGETVRLLCISSPKEGELGYFESKGFLESLIINKTIRMEKDIMSKDQDTILLRYVWVNSSSGLELFVNKEIITHGYGRINTKYLDYKKCLEISNLQS